MALVVPPDNVVAGDPGHILAHNDTSDVLTSVLQSISLLPGVPIVVSAVAPSSPVNNEIWFNVSGNALSVETWNSTLGVWIPTSLSNIPKPADFGLISESFDMTSASGQVQAVNQTVYLNKLVFRQPNTVTDIWCGVTTPAVGPVANQNWAGLISSAGVLLSSGQIPPASLTAAGPVSVALAVPKAVSTPFAWSVHVFNCATPPFLLRGNPFPFMNNANLAPSAYQNAVNGLAATTLPSSITPSSNTQATALALWTAAS